MPEYRLYCLSEAGGFTKAHEIEASNDDDALARAKAMKLPVRCELWERGRMVARLDPHRTLIAGKPPYSSESTPQ